ncbi:hypothetical protein Ccrd_017035 [Cynara cardunculus var. scolymus]|uniref:Uncharacterized protein n=1 Tax=Cynara cardunculus var. scolymus TaxID=59895 RepID=A0A103Y8U7_CYNCS|nr:hypothetical protein Ccrd_017035 [Cynara cardunculus var. scolymus]
MHESCSANLVQHRLDGGGGDDTGGMKGGGVDEGGNEGGGDEVGGDEGGGDVVGGDEGGGDVVGGDEGGGDVVGGDEGGGDDFGGDGRFNSNGNGNWNNGKHDCRSDTMQVVAVVTSDPANIITKTAAHTAMYLVGLIFHQLRRMQREILMVWEELHFL